jgi:hypothetical protein
LGRRPRERRRGRARSVGGWPASVRICAQENFRYTKLCILNSLNLDISLSVSSNHKS